MSEEKKTEVQKPKKPSELELLKKENEDLKAEVAELKKGLGLLASKAEDRIVTLGGQTYEVDGDLETVASVTEKAKKRFVEQDRTVVVLKRFGF